MNQNILPPYPADDASVPSVVATTSVESDDMTAKTINLDDWYTKVVTHLKLGTHERANQMYEENLEVPFTDVVRELKKEQEAIDTIGDSIGTSRRVRMAVSQTRTGYFLTKHNGMVRVVYGPKWCDLLHPSLPRLVVTMGDYRRMGQSVMDPPVMMLSGTIAAQKDILGGLVLEMCQPLTDIIAELEEANDPAQLAEVEEDVMIEEVTTWRLLPVPAKVAVLFMRGIRVLEAAKLVQGILNQVPEEEEGDWRVLADFVRIACTQGDVADVEWEAVNPYTSDELFAWCEGLKSSLAKPAAASREEMPRAVPLSAAAPEGQHNVYAEILAAAVTLSQTNAAERSKKTKYSRALVEDFMELAGVIEETICDSSIMTPFFRGLEELKSKTEARKYIEKALRPAVNDDPMADVEMTTIFSTETINAIKAIDVIAGDTYVQWEDRLKGLSLFSLAPAPGALIHLAKRERDRCVAFEMADYQKEDDIRRASSIHTRVEEWPLTPDRLRAWVLTFYRLTEIMFGPSFILRTLLRRLLGAMRQELEFQAWNMEGCMRLTWGIHRGIRAALSPGRNYKILTSLVNTLECGDIPTFSSLGPDITTRIRSVVNAQKGASQPTAVSGGGKRPAVQQQNPPKRLRAGFGNPVSGPEFAKTWEADVREVQKVVGTKGGDFCSDQNKLNELFGDEFRALMPASEPTPCMSYFILGRCHDQCSRSHTTTAPPTQKAVAGLKARVHSHCQQILQAKKG
jgi:hypothetical protein